MKITMNGKVKTQSGYGIYVKILSTQEVLDEHDHYLLMIQGGPGFGHTALQPWVNSFAQQRSSTPIHFILFDPLNCGLSDEASDPDKEFTVEYYAELASQLVEAVYIELELTHMNLSILGGSFGSMTAMTMPAMRPEWVMGDSSIQLNQLISLAGPISWQSIVDSRAYVEKHYSNHPKLQNYLESMDKLYQGNIESRDDYIHNVVYQLGSLYTMKYEDFDKTLPGWFLYNCTDLTMWCLGLLSYFSEQIGYMYQTLNDCNLTILNSFFRNNFNNFNLLNIIKDNLSIYQKINICSISGQWDHLAPPETNAFVLLDTLPENMSCIIVQARHTLTTDGFMTPITTIVGALLQGDTEQVTDLLGDIEWCKQNRISEVYLPSSTKNFLYA